MPIVLEEKNVVKYMSAATSVEDWSRRCDEVTRANNGRYPRFWFRAIERSGLARRVRASWTR